MGKPISTARQFSKQIAEKAGELPFAPQQLLAQSLMLLCSFVLGGARLFGDVAPFSVALVAAAPAPLMVAALVGGAGRFIIAQNGIVVFRNIAVLVTAAILNGSTGKIKWLRHSALTAPLIAFVCPLTTGLTVLAAQGFNIDGLLLFFTEAVLAAGAAYFFDRAFSMKTVLMSGNRLSQQQTATLQICCCVLLLAAASFEIEGIAPARIIAVYLILAAACLTGVSGSSAFGAAMGFAISLAGENKSYLIGCYAFGGLVSGVFSPIGQLACAAAFAVSNAVIAIANADKFETLPAIYEAAVATVAFVMTPKSFFESIEKYFSSSVHLPTLEAMRRSLITRLSTASAGMSEMAKTVQSVSDGMKKLESPDVSPATARVNQIKEIVGDQFSAISVTLDDIAAEFDGESLFDVETAASVAVALKGFGMEVKDCFCFRSEADGLRIDATVSSVHGSIGKAAFMRAVGQACGRKMNYPSVREYEGFTLLSFCELPEYDLIIGKAQIAADTDGLCGDCCESFYDSRGNKVIVLSDGMGTGARAAVDGAMTATLFSKLIKAGFGFDSALHLVNSALIVKSEEESLATLDVSKIDLRSGEVEIMKAGAGATLVFRNSRLVTIESQSMPAGILREIGFERSTLRLSSGDIIVMASDGVSPAAYRRIAKILRNSKKNSPSEIAGEVAKAAREMCTELHPDDITVIVAIIER